MKRFTLATIIVSVLFLSILAGCGTKSNVAGTWVVKEDSLNISVGLKITLKEDGTVLMGPVKGQYKVKGTNVLITDTNGKEILSLELKGDQLLGESDTRRIIYEKEK